MYINPLMNFRYGLPKDTKNHPRSLNPLYIVSYYKYTYYIHTVIKCVQVHVFLLYYNYVFKVTKYKGNLLQNVEMFSN